MRWCSTSGATPPTILPVCIRGDAVKTVPSYKYLRLVLNNKLDWSVNTDYLYKKGQSSLYFLASFNICKKLLEMFYPSVVASVLFYATTLEEVTEQRTLSRLQAIMDNATHPLWAAFTQQSSSFSDRLLIDLLHKHI